VSSPRIASFVVLALAATPALALDGPAVDPFVVVGLDVGKYGIGSPLSGPSLDAKLGFGFRGDYLALALIGEGDYGIGDFPLRDTTGSYWVLPQLDASYTEESIRLHAFIAGGWGRFLRSDVGRQQEVKLWGGGVGLGLGAFDATVRWLKPLSPLEPRGTRLERQSVPGVGMQLTVGMRFDLGL
jgi:hypothetical protein